MSKAQPAPAATTTSKSAKLPKLPAGSKPSRGKHKTPALPPSTDVRPTQRPQIDMTATQDAAGSMRQAVTSQTTGIVGFAARCPHCDMAIERRYVVYRRNPKTLVVIQGQWETVHITADGDVSGNGRCRVSPMSKYLDLDSESGTSNYTATKTSKSKTIHMKRDRVEQDTLGRPMITLCGALGGRTTDDMTSATCNNCKKTNERNRNQANKTKETANMSTVNTTTTTTNEAPKMSVKEKIAAAKQRAEAKKASAPAATLVGKDGPTAGKTAATPATKPLTGAAKAAKEKAAKAPKVAKVKVVGPCGCGCGEEVERNFRPGHDARFHSWIKKVGAGTMKISELPNQVKVGMFPGMKDAKEGTGALPKISEANYLAGLKKQQ